MDMNRNQTILISGYAKLPAHITSEEVYHTAVVVVLVNKTTGTILKAEVSSVTDLASDFIAQLMVGYSLADGPENLVDRFDRLYFGQMKKALVTAVKMIFAKFEEVQTAQGID